MKLWIARNPDNTLVLFQSKPIFGENFTWEEKYNEGCIYIDEYLFINEYLFPEVTFENSPQMVEVKLVKEE